MSTEDVESLTIALGLLGKRLEKLEKEVAYLRKNTFIAYRVDGEELTAEERTKVSIAMDRVMNQALAGLR